MEREEDEWARQEVIEQWQNAGRSILSSVRMVRNAETLGDKFATGAERYLHTCIVLQQHCTCQESANPIGTFTGALSRLCDVLHASESSVSWSDCYFNAIS